MEKNKRGTTYREWEIGWILDIIIRKNLTKRTGIKQRLEDVKYGAMQTSIGRAFQAEETINQRP